MQALAGLLVPAASLLVTDCQLLMANGCWYINILEASH